MTMNMSVIRGIVSYEKIKHFKNEPVREKTNNLGSDQVPTKTRLYGYRRWLEAGNFGFRKRNCTICVVKTKVLISFAVLRS